MSSPPQNSSSASGHGKQPVYSRQLPYRPQTTQISNASATPRPSIASVSQSSPWSANFVPKHGPTYAPAYSQSQLSQYPQGYVHQFPDPYLNNVYAASTGAGQNAYDQSYPYSSQHPGYAPQSYAYSQGSQQHSGPSSSSLQYPSTAITGATSWTAATPSGSLPAPINSAASLHYPATSSSGLNFLPPANTAGPAQSSSLSPSYIPVAPTPQFLAEYQKNYRKRPARWFKEGKVFKTLFVEPVGNSASSQFTVMSNIQGEPIFQKIKIFIIVRVGLGFSTVLAISSHGNNGAAQRPGQHEYGIAYTGRTVPNPLPGETHLQPISIKVDPEPAEALSKESRIHYSRIYNVEDTAKVKPIGIINVKSWRPFLEQFRNVAGIFGQSQSSSPSMSPRSLQCPDNDFSERAHFLCQVWNEARSDDEARDGGLNDLAEFVLRFSRLDMETLVAYHQRGGFTWEPDC